MVNAPATRLRLSSDRAGTRPTLVLCLLFGLAVLAVWPAAADAAAAAWSAPAGTAQAVLQQELSDPSLHSGRFAQRVALDGDTALVAAADATVAGRLFAGAVDVFVRSAGVWTLQATLTSPVPAESEGFGTSLAFEGDTAVIGAPGKVVGSDVYAGTAYVFTRSGATWSLQSELADPRPSRMDQYGIQVALSGDTALVGAVDAGNLGAPGEVWAFTRTGTTWSMQAELTPPLGMNVLGYGTVLALDHDTAFAAAPDCIPLGGRVFVFTRAGTVWTRRTAIVSAESSFGDGFGVSVAASGGTVLIGGGTGGWPGPGPRAHVFTGSGAGWKQQGLLVPAGGTGAGSSQAVALSGDTALVASGNQDGAAWPGTVHVFRRSDARWRQLTVLTVPSTSVYDRLGASLAVDEGTALAGNPGRIKGEEVVGACDVFLLSAEAPPAYPVTTAYMTPGLNASGWSKKPVSVALQTTDPLAAVTGTFVHGPSDLYWMPYSEPLTITQDGIWKYAVFSTDAAANIETLTGFTVRIDSVRPSVSTGQDFACRRGARITFRVTLVDRSAPLCTLYVHITNKNSGRTIKTVNLGRWRPGKPSVPWKVSVGRGSYLFRILATDLAGNRQSRTSTGSLTVR